MPSSPLIWLVLWPPVQCWLPKTAGWLSLRVNSKCPYEINGRPAQVSKSALEDLVFRLPFAAARAEGFLISTASQPFGKCCRRSA